MKKIIGLTLILVLVLGCLSGCVRGKTALLLVEDTRTDQTQLLWAGFSKKAKKMGMKAVLVGLTDESAISYTAYQLWEEAVSQHDPDVVAVVGLTDNAELYPFLYEQEHAVVAIHPASDLCIPEAFCVNGATDVTLARMAASRIVEMEPPFSGRIRLLYNRNNEEVEQVFVSLMEEAAYLNMECTPLTGRISEQNLLNSFTEDTVAAYNASDYDTEATDVSNFILSVATRPHLESLQQDQASAILCRDYETIGIRAAEACGQSLRGKEPTAVTVDPLLITADGPDRNGAQYWLKFYE